MDLTRRAAAIGAVAAMAQTASATPQTEQIPVFSAWVKPSDPKATAPLDVLIDTGEKRMSLRDWLGGRPAVLALWATWCPPCLEEKEEQAALAKRLAKAGARTRILALQTFDDQPLPYARNILAKLHAETLENARSSPAAEKAFIPIFGASPDHPSRTYMPALMLLNADGVQLGLAVGEIRGPSGGRDYWRQKSTFDMLAAL